LSGLLLFELPLILLLITIQIAIFTYLRLRIRFIDQAGCFLLVLIVAVGIRYR